MYATLLLCYTAVAQAQMYSIRGAFPQLKGAEIVLKGYAGFAEKELARTLSDNNGNFTLTYAASYKGAALLQLQDAGNTIVLLNAENFGMQWTDIKDINTLSFSNSAENTAFINGVEKNTEVNNKLAGLNYLIELYQKEPERLQWLRREASIQKNKFELFVWQMPQNSYAAYYLRLRKFISDIAHSVQTDTTMTEKQEAFFNQIDFADSRLWQSGLLADLLGSTYQQAAGQTDTGNAKLRINKITDVWIQKLATNTIKQQDVAEYCFKMLEQQGRMASAEHIAINMLGQTGCVLDEKRTNLFEQYRKMGIGNRAPDIKLQNGKQLSKLNNKYKLVVFGASWCQDCVRDYPTLVGVYKQLKAKHDLELLYVSLDNDKASFDAFYKEAPFLTWCDTKGWESEPAMLYHIVATPSYFVLDKDLKILAKLKSPREFDIYLQNTIQK